MSGFEENEISKNAFGGTEIAKRTLNELLDKDLLSNFQIISSRVRELQEDKIRIFFAHDLAEDPEVSQFRDVNYRNKFHHMVFISNWQYQRYQTILGIPPSIKHSIIESGMYPLKPIDKYGIEKIQSKPQVANLCYTSTPQRGLELLVPVFEKLQEKYKGKIHLDVFSSFKIYGWDDADKQYEPLYQKCRENPDITYHGFTPHDELIKYLETKGHILAYPCIWQETSCRAMLEAMSGKLFCVHPNIAALPETSGALNLMYQYDEDKNIHANMFLAAVEQAVNMVLVQDQTISHRLTFNKAYIDARYHIEKVKVQWEMLLRHLLNQYPDVANRKPQSEMFVYKW